MSVPSISTPERKKILKTLFISLLLDLISFTFILPLFPSVLEYYRSKDDSPTSLLNGVFHYLNAYKNAFSRPIDSRYDIILLGGAFGSLFSLLQAVAAPFIGRLSDIYGRRRAMLFSMAGNILSVGLWVGATDFRTFLASRVVGGLTEGNVQLANAIVSDISDETQRGSAMALVGACFSIAFTFGPILGAALATIEMVASNKFAMAAGVSLLLVVVETLYIYFALPETHPRLRDVPVGYPGETKSTSKINGATSSIDTTKPISNGRAQAPAMGRRTTQSTMTTLKLLHFLFLVSFSGLEFSLPFVTAAFYGERLQHSSPSALNGRLLSMMGLIASLLQGTIVRRLPPLVVVRAGVVTCSISFFVLARASSITGLYSAGALLAMTSATVVTGINSLGSLEAQEVERGAALGQLRSWGQVGRALGPLLFCTLFWWAGREVAYITGGTMMVGVGVIVFTMLQSPKAGKGRVHVS
ncbi:MFS-type transporter [Penicillium ucsense]|uniref:MFS-type transporter n=1 Tax=Penicillium ucsense TaxID=2839758 RepID=A0A8J8W6R0_9EURO|nr:MFS-type transporter [Penicillium ucsense]KAF7738540.1 MFS-type transporter [Penicillium ucsense]